MTHSPKKPRLLQRVRNTCRRRHLSIHTEKAYVNWIKRFVLFHNKTHPANLDHRHITEYLTYLATERHAAASTQNQALSALLFLYHHVLEVDPGKIDSFEYARRPKRLPVVLSQREVRRLVNHMADTNGLAASLLYGSGLRLIEGLRLKDLAFDYHQMTLHDDKGRKDRIGGITQNHGKNIR